jgi:hypothetical protein
MRHRARAGIRLCLDRARECERLAELATDVSSRETYLRMAGQWHALATDRQFVQQVDGLCAGSAGSKEDRYDPSA